MRSANPATHVRPPDRTCVPPARPPAPLALPEPCRFTLSCGARVGLIERHDLPLVAMEVLMPGGAGAVSAERAGLAAFTAEMVDEGAGARSALEFADALEGLGATLDSVAGYDDSRVTLISLSSRFAEALPLLADVLARPTFEPDELERVRRERMDIVLQLADEPASLAGDALGLRLYGPAHPWGPPLLGTRTTLAAVTREDVARFHAERYHPGNATLLVAGDVTESELRDLLEARLAGWERRGATVHTLPAVPEPDRPVVCIVDRPGAAQSEIRVGRVAVARSAPDYFPMVALNTVLGGAFTSRLNTRLREEKGFTYGARSGFHARSAPGPFVAQAAVHTPATGEAVAIFLEELERMIEEPVPEEELERAKRYTALRLPQRFETAGDVVARMAEQALHGLADDYWTAYVPRLLAVDAEEVRAAARRHLNPRHMTVIVVGDRAAIERPLDALGIPVEVLAESAA